MDIAINSKYLHEDKTIKILSKVDTNIKARQNYFNCYITNNMTGLSYFTQISQALLLTSKLIT